MEHLQVDISNDACDNISQRYENIDLPSIILVDIESYKDKPWRDPNNKLNDYFNYGFNEEIWKRYCDNMKMKYAESIKVLEESSLNDNKPFKYLFNLPSDFGGIGEVQDDSKYENLNFFEYKSKNKHLPCIEIKQGMVCVPLENSDIHLHNPLNNTNFLPNISPSNIPYFNPLNWHPGQYAFRPPYDQMRQNLYYPAIPRNEAEISLKNINSSKDKSSERKTKKKKDRHRSRSRRKSKKDYNRSRSRSRSRKKRRSSSRNKKSHRK